MQNKETQFGIHTKTLFSNWPIGLIKALLNVKKNENFDLYFEAPKACWTKEFLCNIRKDTYNINNIYRFEGTINQSSLILRPINSQSNLGNHHP